MREKAKERSVSDSGSQWKERADKSSQHIGCSVWAKAGVHDILRVNVSSLSQTGNLLDYKVVDHNGRKESLKLPAILPVGASFVKPRVPAVICPMSQAGNHNEAILPFSCRHDHDITGASLVDSLRVTSHDTLPMSNKEIGVGGSTNTELVSIGNAVSTSHSSSIRGRVSQGVCQWM